MQPSNISRSVRRACVLCLLSSALAGCLSTGPLTSGITAASPLLEVSVPRFTPMQGNLPPALQAIQLVDPRGKPPPFEENIAARRHCSALSLEYTGQDLGLSAQDRAILLKAFSEGLRLEQQRHIWRFEVARAAAQEKFLHRGQVPQVSPPTPTPQARPRLPGQASAPAVDSVRRTQLKPLLPVPPENQRGLEQVAYNRSVLQAQEAELIASEQRLGETLVAVMARTGSAWQSMPVVSVGWERVLGWDHFRTEQIHGCIARRGQSTATVQAALAAQDQRFKLLAQTVLAVQSDLLVKGMQASPDTTSFDDLWNERFPTPLLKQVADADPSVLAQARQQRRELLASETRAGELASRKAQAENVRVVEANRQRLRDSLARNLAPQTDDVVAVVLANSMALTEAQGFSVRRVSESSYDVYNTFLGKSWKAATYTLYVNDLNCKPAGTKQECSYNERTQLTGYDLMGGPPNINEAQSTGRGHRFFWSDSGLQAEAKLNSGHLFLINLAGQSGRASKHDGLESREAMREQIMQRERDKGR